MIELSDHLPERLGEWHRVAAGLIARSVLTVTGHALGGLALFAAITLVTELALADELWLRALYPFYVLLGALVGASLGLAKALRRETALAAERSSGLLRSLVDRAVDELAIPEDGIEPSRLRALADLEGIVPGSHGRLTRGLAAFAVSRALESAGMAALHVQLHRAAGEAEARGEPTVSRAAVREATRNGVAAAFAEQLDAGWGANERVSRVTSVLALVSLPVLAALFG